MLGFSPTNEPGEGTDPPTLELPAAMATLDGASISTGRVPTRAPVPPSPPQRAPPTTLVADTNGIGPDETYSRDEEQLNNFLKLHPMLSLEATSQRTLQMLSTMFEKVSLRVENLCVPTAY